MPLSIPVEVWTGGSSTVGKTENVSLGGLLLKCPGNFEPKTEIDVLFNLPNGHTVQSRCAVVHLQPDARIGVMFVQITDESRNAMAEFIRNLATYTRRGGRISKHMYVTIRELDKDDGLQELAETVVVSEHGGLMVTRAKFKLGDSVFLWWPEGKRGAEAKIVFSRPGGTGGLLELGFEFHDTDNFWGFDFPAGD